MPSVAGLPQDTHCRAGAELGTGAALLGAVVPTWAVPGTSVTVGSHESLGRRWWRRGNVFAPTSIVSSLKKLKETLYVDDESRTPGMECQNL
jgi:hypothetical protein